MAVGESGVPTGQDKPEAEARDPIVRDLAHLGRSTDSKGTRRGDGYRMQNGATDRDLGMVLGEDDGILRVKGRLEGGEAGIEGRHWRAKMGAANDRT